MVKYIFNKIELVALSDLGEDTKTLISENSYDLYINSNDSLWLGTDGKVYEFEYFPYEDELIRVYKI